jgi:hypothetical protein
MIKAMKSLFIRQLSVTPQEKKLRLSLSLRSKSVFFALILFSSVRVFSGNLEEKFVYAFKGGDSIDPIKMVVVGETMGVEKASVFETKMDNNMMDIDTRPDTVTVKVLYNPGIRPGQVLYLIEKVPDHDSFKDGNIVGQIKVVSIFDTSFFGQRLRAEGHLRLIEEKTMTVAMPVGKDRLNDAIIVKKQGDYFFFKNNIPKAIYSYKKAVSLDHLYPDAHYSLAKLFLKEGNYVSASFEFGETWQHKDKFSDDNDKFSFLVDYIRLINYKFQLESGSIQQGATIGRMNELKKALLVYEEAKLIHPEDYELNLTITETYFLLYGSAERLLSGQEKRDTYEAYFEKTLSSVEDLLSHKKNDYRLFRVAAIVYNDKLSTMRGADKKEGYAYTRTKLKKLVNQYLTYKPTHKKVDPQILSILEN